MFNNPLNRKYQTGGPAPTDDERKDMEDFITWIKSNVEGFKDKSTKEIAQSISDMAKSEEGKKSVQNLYSKYQKSKKQKSRFANGGKMQSFICKHAHGGNVDCGCGGMVVRAEPGTQLPERRVRRAARRNATRVPDAGSATRRKVGYTDIDGNHTVYEDAVVNGTSAETYATATPQGDTIVVQKFPVAGGNDTAIREYPMGSIGYRVVMPRLRPHFKVFDVPEKQQGGNLSMPPAPPAAYGIRMPNWTEQGIIDYWKNPEYYESLRNEKPTSNSFFKPLKISKPLNSLKPIQQTDWISNNSYTGSASNNITNTPFDKDAIMDWFKHNSTQGNQMIPKSYGRFKCGGNVEKHQEGGKNTWQKIVSDGSDMIKNVYNKVDDFLNPAKKYEQEHGVKIQQFALPTWMTPASKLQGLSALEKAKVASDKWKAIGDGAMDLAKVGAAALLGQQLAEEQESKKCGGKITKAQGGEEMPDTGTISQGKSRSKLGKAIDDNPKARHFVEGTKRFVKSPVFKLPAVGLAAYGGWKLGGAVSRITGGSEIPNLANATFAYLSQFKPKALLEHVDSTKNASDIFWLINRNSALDKFLSGDKNKNNE